MNITRRDALLGATAAAAVTGLTVAPLAMKAAGVKAALAGDPEIEALFVQLAAADAHAEATGRDDAYHLFNDIQAQIIQTPARTLGGALSKARIAWSITAAAERLDERNPAFDPNYGQLGDSRFIWSTLQDLERLAEAAHMATQG